MKNKINLTIILTIGLALILACGNADSNQPNMNTVPGSATDAAPVAVKAVDITKEYDENELAADAKYKGNTLSVTGKVSEIAEVMGSYQVDLEGFKKSGINLLSVKCTFAESEKGNIAKLKKGQMATLTGTGGGKTMNLYVGLNECKIK
jgi:hypothetical protein